MAIATMNKIPKGCADLVGEDFRKFQWIRNTLEQAFAAEGGVPLETPVFERTDVLLGKYGQEADTKLVYNLEDQGGERLTLRYDLTVPFTRYILENGVDKMRRWAIGKVWRRDQPSRGRWREFWQADFDILGEDNTTMMAEGLLLAMAARVLRALGIAEFSIAVNDVRNIRAMLVDSVGVPEGKWRSLCPAIDKLDKQTFDATIPEFRAAWADIDIERLRVALTGRVPICAETTADLAQLRDIAAAWGFEKELVFTPSLARGLDYYSGFVWEIKAAGLSATIVAGGRYDGLLKKSLVGISFGVSRLMLLAAPPADPAPVERAMVCALGSISMADRLYVIERLRRMYPRTVLIHDLGCRDRKLAKLLQEATRAGCTVCFIIAEKEWAERKLIQKNLLTGEQSLLQLV